MAAFAQAINVRRGRKVDQVLDGARTIFMRDGFEGASVDAIAAEAGVSKATLYSYFADKRELFLEVTMGECRRLADEAEELISLTAPPLCVLPEAARRIIAFSLSEFGRSSFRICVAESVRFPDLAREFFESGPVMVRQRLAVYMSGAVKRGELLIDDVELAADQFAELCKATIFPSVCFGIKRSFSTEDQERVAKGAVEMFMARYGVPQPNGPSPDQ